MKALFMHPLFRITLVCGLIAAIAIPFSSDARSPKSGDDVPAPTQAELQSVYGDTTQPPLRILIVPGHEPDYGGAVYQDVYERDLTVEIADQLAQYLKGDQRIEVIVARSKTDWQDDIGMYFEESWRDIEKFVKDKKKQMERKIKRGDVTRRDTEDQVDHAAAPSDVALRLYGINKWAGENDIDLVVHLHVNDTTDHGPNDPSAHSGYAVYVPDHQFGNSMTATALGDDIAEQLARLNATSTLDIENKGVVEDQELIAVGANGTLSVPSVLVEYGYITEPRFHQPVVRSVVTQDYALATYRGIEHFLGSRRSTQYVSSVQPHTFTKTSLAKMGSSSVGTYALQAALHSINLYPTFASSTPANQRLMAPTLTNCPIDGVMSHCVTNGIEAFQTAKGLTTTGTLGPKTIAALNTLFSAQPVVATQLPTTSSCALPRATPKLGAKDTSADGDVIRLQKLLAQDPAVYPEKLVTGYYGPATKRALETFQTVHGIAAKGQPGYGLIGPKTKEALQASFCK